MTTPEQTSLTLSRLTRPNDANLVGTVHGGEILTFVDEAAGAIAARFAGTAAVTAALDEVIFRAPVRVGDILRVHGRVNWAGRTSMEVGLRVEAERWDHHGTPAHVASARFVMVAVDQERRPVPVPELELATQEDRRRHREAEIRRRHRLAQRAEVLASRQADDVAGAEGLRMANPADGGSTPEVGQ
ncbi:acyl-CoA thioesterase [Kribbia dieselivorans]|uniref:acyl-CoA thioesterase n=1 Tax=Kribbia dieselivorans TaxID=331526 RepID=UPI0009FB360B|nr:acyl-CoA thioesterase [Kribbia dieselivorans]